LSGHHPGARFRSATAGHPPGPAQAVEQSAPTDGRRGVAGYIFGAFQPTNGAAFTRPYERRITTNWVDFASLPFGS
jgi:hypothetical protein